MAYGEYNGCTLYHYTSERGLLGILSSGTIYATKIEDLADEQEMTYGREALAQGFARAGSNAKGAETRKLAMCAEMVRALPNIAEVIRINGDEPISRDDEFEWYVACFSDLRDSLPLWQGFTRNRGYALGLEYKPADTVRLQNLPPRRVVYTEAARKAVIRRMVCAARQELDSPDGRYQWMIPLDDFLCLKQDAFAFEHEWRVIWSAPFFPPPPKCESKGTRTRNVHHVKLPLSDWVLKEIVCGPLAKFGPRSRTIRNGIRAYPHAHGDIPVVKSSIPLWR